MFRTQTVRLFLCRGTPALRSMYLRLNISRNPHNNLASIRPVSVSPRPTMSQQPQPPAQSEASSTATPATHHDHVLRPLENSKASRSIPESDSGEEPRASSPTPSLNLEAAAPSSQAQGQGTNDDDDDEQESWLQNKGRSIQVSWPNTSRTARRVYRFFRGPSPRLRMPLPRMHLHPARTSMPSSDQFSSHNNALARQNIQRARALVDHPTGIYRHQIYTAAATSADFLDFYRWIYHFLCFLCPCQLLPHPRRLVHRVHLDLLACFRWMWTWWCRLSTLFKFHLRLPLSRPV